MSEPLKPLNSIMVSHPLSMSIVPFPLSYLYYKLSVNRLVESPYHFLLLNKETHPQVSLLRF